MGGRPDAREAMVPENTEPTPETETIITEAQRRIQAKSQPPTPPAQQKLIEGVNRAVFWLARHWLAMFNALVALFLGGALLAPVLQKAGMAGAARVLYTFYSFTCHQYPFRSWFFFGPSLARPLHAPLSVVEMNETRTFVGHEAIGYKIAICQRDVAIYGAIVLAGLLYGLLRKRDRPLPPLPLWAYFAFGVLPMMLDGGIQWLSYFAWTLSPALLPLPFETIPLLRALTGALFGVGIVAAAYPHINAYFVDVRHALKLKFDWANPGP